MNSATPRPCYIVNQCMDIFVNSATPRSCYIVNQCMDIFVNSAIPRSCYIVNKCMDIFVNSRNTQVMLYCEPMYGHICEHCIMQHPGHVIL